MDEFLLRGVACSYSNAGLAHAKGFRKDFATGFVCCPFYGSGGYPYPKGPLTNIYNLVFPGPGSNYNPKQKPVFIFPNMQHGDGLFI